MSDVNDRKAAPRGKKPLFNLPNTDLNAEGILIKGEKILVRGEVHWGIFWKSGAILVFGFLLSLLILPLGMILILAGLIGLVHSLLMQHMLLLVLTDKRILMRTGILQVDVVDMRFKNIESIELERMLPGFILGYSNVIIMGVGQRFVRIPYVANGVQFRRAYNELVLNAEENQDIQIIVKDKPE